MAAPAPSRRSKPVASLMTAGRVALRRTRLRELSRFLDEPMPTLDRWWHEWREFNLYADGDDLELYLIIRARRPEHVVETGVRRGFSSSAILRALDHNGKGRLTSIDLPLDAWPGETHWTGGGKGTGLEVPEYLKTRWNLVIGDARTELPRMTDYDAFWHDSDHTYDHHRFELETALKHLPTGGTLLSDDVDLSAAWDDVTRGLGRSMKWPVLRRQRGALIVAHGGSAHGR